MAAKKTKKTTSTKGLLAAVRAQEKKPKLKAISMPKLSIAIKRQPASPLTATRKAQQAQFRTAMRTFFGL